MNRVCAFLFAYGQYENGVGRVYYPEAPEATQGSGGRILEKGTFTLLGKQAKGNF